MDSICLDYSKRSFSGDSCGIFSLLRGGKQARFPYISWDTVSHTVSTSLLLLQISQEGESFPTPISVAALSELVKTTVDEDDDAETQDVPIPNVKAAVLTKVLEYCTHYQTEKMTDIQTPLKSSKLEDLVQPWYANYVDVEQTLLFELVTAANFMDIKPLLDLTCLAVSIYIKVSRY